MEFGRDVTKVISRLTQQQQQHPLQWLNRQTLDFSFQFSQAVSCNNLLSGG